MGETEELRAWLIALRTPGLGPVALRDWLQRAGHDIHAVLAQLWRQRVALGSAATAWLRQPDADRLAADLSWLALPGHRLLCCTDADFPPQLEHIPQPPAALFVSGDAATLLYPQVAVVGARGASASGLVNAGAFTRALVRAGFAITSGLADGIDGAAHVAALDAGGATLAVMGTGPDLVYPRKHHALAQRIASQGALVSEFPPGTAARADHFPRRNRLIAGLALGTLVVEAGVRSGSLITARLAVEQGREVFALPGSIHHELARGCHRLIRDGARLVEDATEMVEILSSAARLHGAELAARLAEPPAAGRTGPPCAHAADAVGAPPGLGNNDPAAQDLLYQIGHDPVSLDELALRTGMSPGALGAQLLMLELDAQIESLAGNRYQRRAPRTAN